MSDENSIKNNIENNEEQNVELKQNLQPKIANVISQQNIKRIYFFATLIILCSIYFKYNYVQANNN